MRPVTTKMRVPSRLAECGSDDRSEGDADGDRQDPHTRGQRAVVADELEVLGDEEDEPK